MESDQDIQNNREMEDFNEIYNRPEINKKGKGLIQTAIYTIWCVAVFAFLALIYKRIPTSSANQSVQAPFPTVSFTVGPSIRSVESSTSLLATEVNSPSSISATVLNTSLKTSLLSQISRVQHPLNLVPTQSCLTVLVETGKEIQKAHTNYQSDRSLDVNRWITDARPENSVTIRNLRSRNFVNKLIDEDLVLRLRGGAVIGVRPLPAIYPVRRIARPVVHPQIRMLAPVDAFARLICRRFVPQRARTTLPVNTSVLSNNEPLSGSHPMSFLASVHRAQNLALRFIEGGKLEGKRNASYGSFENKRQGSPLTLFIPLRSFNRGKGLYILNYVKWKDGGKKIGAQIKNHPITLHMIKTPLKRNSAGWENMIFFTRQQLTGWGVDDQLINHLVYKGKGHVNFDQVGVGLKKR
jgi:hypothetical protein